MPDIVVANEGEQFLLRRMLGIPSVPSAAFKLRVYVNDYTPLADITLGDLTEASWSGYSPFTLDPADWTPPATIDGQAAAFYGTGPLLFTPASGVTIAYGAYLTSNDGATLLWAWRFDAPQTVTSSAPCVVNLSFAARSQSEPM